MRSSIPLTISLPEALARSVRARVASGAYASDSEVIREGLRALAAQEAAVESWLQSEGVARFDAWQAAPTATLSADEAGAALHKHMAARNAEPV